MKVLEAVTEKKSLSEIEKVSKLISQILMREMHKENHLYLSRLMKIILP